MKQLYLVSPGQLRLRVVDDPQPGVGEVVVEVRGATTCGTDLKTFRRGHPKFPMPTPMGHEFSGVICDVGLGVDKWKIGQSVMCAPTAPCGGCPLCRRGLSNLCPLCMSGLVLGAFAEKVLVPAHIVMSNLYEMPEHLDYYEAALMEPLACAVFGQQKLPSLKGKSVAIVGAGPIGLLHQMLALEAHPSQLIVLGRRESRLDLAKQIGADHVIDVDEEENLVLSIEDRTGGRGADIVIECTGQPQVWIDSVLSTADRGTTLLFGGCQAETKVALPLWRVWDRCLTVLGVFHFTPQAVALARDLLCAGRLPAKCLVSEVRPLSDFQAIFEDLMAGKGVKYGVNPKA